MRGRLARIRLLLGRESDRRGQRGHVLQTVQPPLQHVVDAAKLGEILVAAHVLFAVAETQQVPLVHVALHDLFKQVVQRLVRVRDQQRAVIRVLAVQVDHDLHGHIGLARAGRSDHHREPDVSARANRLDLHRREAHAVALGHVADRRVGRHVGFNDHAREGSGSGGRGGGGGGGRGRGSGSGRTRSVRHASVGRGRIACGLSCDCRCGLGGRSGLGGLRERRRREALIVGRVIVRKRDAEGRVQRARLHDHAVARKRVVHVREIEEGVAEIERGQARGELVVLRGARVAIAEEHVVQPVGHGEAADAET